MVQANTAGSNGINDFGIDHTFLFEYAGGECGWCVGRKHRHGSLSDDWAVVVLVVNKVHSAAADFTAVVDNGGVDSAAVMAMPAERRDQAGVDVDHPVLKIGGDFDSAEKASHHDEIRLSGTAGVKNFLAELGNISMRAMIDDSCGDVGVVGEVQTRGGWVVTDDLSDVRV